MISKLIIRQNTSKHIAKKYIQMVMAVCLLMSTALISVNTMAENISVELRSETWDIPRHGELLIKLPELATIVSQWSRNQKQRIDLYYPGGEEGELWVEELKDWLVSLGIPSRSIQALPGSKARDVINIVLIEAVKKDE